LSGENGTSSAFSAKTKEKPLDDKQLEKD